MIQREFCRLIRERRRRRRNVLSNAREQSPRFQSRRDISDEPPLRIRNTRRPEAVTCVTFTTSRVYLADDIFFFACRITV